jgi:lysophospholipase L1-like esterase
MRIVLAAVLTALLLSAWSASEFRLEERRLWLLDHHGFRHDTAAMPDPLLGFRLRPSVTVNGFRHNAYGFAGREISRKKPAGVFRIFCLGGSTTLGAGVPTERYSYPAILEEIFARSAKPGQNRIEVVNAGVFGYNSLHTSILATKLLDRFDPDLYLIMDGLNDLDTAQALTLTSLASLRHVAVAAGETGYGLQDLAEKFKLVDYAGNLRRALSHARTRGIAAVLVTDPMRTLPGPNPPQKTDNPDRAGLLAFGRAVLPGINASLAREFAVPLVDVQSESFDPVLADPGRIPRVWADDLHLTRYGYYLLARDLYHRLMAMPQVRRAVGPGPEASDAELDALFPEIVSWRPADGSGRAKNPTAGDTGPVLAENLKESKADPEGWSFLSPADPAAVAELTLTPAPGATVLRLYPRINEALDCVTVLWLPATGPPQTLFSLAKPVDDGLWTPAEDWYRIALPPGQGRLSIRLQGENAQLWRRAPATVFKEEE